MSIIQDNNSWQEDLSQVCNASHKAINAAKEVKKGAKSIKGIATNVATGNAAGVALELLKNPKLLIALICGFVILLILPFIIVITFVLAFPGAIIESQQAATQGYNETVLGWEVWKAELGSNVDDFITWLVTGEKGENTEAFKTDIAKAEDADFETFAGTSNLLVAVVNNYFRKEYMSAEEDAQHMADERANELYNQAISDGILPEDISLSTGLESSLGDYMDWTFYLIACSSVSNMNNEGATFQVAPIIDIAKRLVSRYELWETALNVSVTDGTTTRMVQKTREEQVRVPPYTEWREEIIPVYDENGQFTYDEDGNILTSLHRYEAEVFNYEWVTVHYEEEEEFPTREIYVGYSAKAKPEGKTHIINQFELSEDKSFEGDISNRELVEEQVVQLRSLYSAALGSLTASGKVLEWIEDFYANHSDLMFDGPSPAVGVMPGPIPDWRNHITSWTGATDIAEHASGHSGLDIASPSGTPLILPYDALAVVATNNLPNIRDDANPRGNFILLYYGESGGVEPGVKKGIFMYYLHLETALVNQSLYQKYPAGTQIATCGTSGQSTGSHWHVEYYVGTQKFAAEDVMR